VLKSFVEGAATDLDALRAFDSNSDGRIDASDTLFASLKVGRDFNQNGHFEANEVFTLAQAGISRIDVVTGIQALGAPGTVMETVAGVLEYNKGQFVRTNGSTGGFADVGLEERAYVSTVYSNGTVSIES
jgi:hypothetical protein